MLTMKESDLSDDEGKTESFSNKLKNPMDSKSLSLFTLGSFLLVSLSVFFIFASFDTDRLSAAVISMVSSFFVVYMIMRANGIKLDYKFKGFGIETELKEGIKNVQTEVKETKRDLNERMEFVTNSITNLTNMFSIENKVSAHQNVDLDSIGKAMSKQIDLTDKLISSSVLEKSGRRYQERKEERKKKKIPETSLSKDKLSKLSQSVAHIELHDDSGAMTGMGTGFLISSHLLLTNNHVLSSTNEARRSQSIFYLESHNSDNSYPKMVFNLDPERFFYTNSQLDFSLVAVDDESVDGIPLNNIEHLKLLKETEQKLLDKHVSIIRREVAKLESIDVAICKVVDVFDEYIHYAPSIRMLGSAGSPVLNDVWEVVAIHHSSVPNMDKDGNYLTEDGRFFNPQTMDRSEMGWVASEAIRISKIIEDLKSQSSTWNDEKRSMVDEILASIN